MNIRSEGDKSFFEDSLKRLREYVERENFKGYDPYDTLLSVFPFRKFGNWPAVLATQVQKRNPFQVRPLLGIKKAYNPKAIGLILQAYSRLQLIDRDSDYSDRFVYLTNWLDENQSKGFSGSSWGYNFPWAGPGKFLDAWTPTVVATGFVAQGLHAYYLYSGNSTARKLLLQSARFIIDHIPRTEFDEGVCFSYSPLFVDCCYNASLLAAETLARAYSIEPIEQYKTLALSAVRFVVSKQHEDGHWKYKLDPKSGKERHQVDFHQGYVLDSIREIIKLTGTKENSWEAAVQNGLEYYRHRQFFSDGRSLWRVPIVYPVEIHNQSQGIITFSRHAREFPEYLPFAKKIAVWTIKNMQDERNGYFYYRKLKYYTNKLSFMRWSNAWMFVALTELLSAINREGRAT
ncbi:MAG: hypothetical protein DWQ44_13940 [Bacteroidetes bacterium]|nr:MAG: hypothetical protein DWQ33_03300 [Bacteroidota bacterium]REK07234.1 MAG: hypothetical protein DWQ39_01745 [Bacteroidota bacterium]REK31779.1 MAG: hypothetical protein DWQ44_13940 [Bacteroidota bacterium]REK48041.1 MAG: hypothetical protein DWQ48_11200 [Bacteroidota bacterium]